MPAANVLRIVLIARRHLEKLPRKLNGHAILHNSEYAACQTYHDSLCGFIFALYIKGVIATTRVPKDIFNDKQEPSG